MCSGGPETSSVIIKEEGIMSLERKLASVIGPRLRAKSQGARNMSLDHIPARRRRVITHDTLKLGSLSSWAHAQESHTGCGPTHRNLLVKGILTCAGGLKKLDVAKDSTMPVALLMTGAVKAMNPLE